MALAQDLLEQSHHLAALDKTRPKQANLRRAISSAYYSVFHLLVANAVLTLVPKRPDGLMPRVGRAFTHGEMKQACNAFKKNPLPDPLATLLAAPASSELISLRRDFIELQEFRHSADYDTARTFSKAETLAILFKAETATTHWAAIQGTDEAAVFLAALAFGARWSK